MLGTSRRNLLISLIAASVYIEDAVASLAVTLTEAEISAIERPYTPRYDFQGVSDDAELARISARIGIKPAGTGAANEDSP